MCVSSGQIVAFDNVLLADLRCRFCDDLGIVHVLSGFKIRCAVDITRNGLALGCQ